MIHDFCLDVRICGLSQHGDEMVNSGGGCEIVPLPDRFTVIITTIIIISSASLVLARVGINGGGLSTRTRFVALLCLRFMRQCFSSGRHFKHRGRLRHCDRVSSGSSDCRINELTGRRHVEELLSITAELRHQRLLYGSRTATPRGHTASNR